jgi:hypothetical protein
MARTREEESSTLVMDESGINAVEADEIEKPPPPDPEVTQSVFDLAYLRRSQEDLKLILEALKEHGTVTIVPDPEIDNLPGVDEEEPPAEDE